MDDQKAELKTALEEMQALMRKLIEITRKIEQEMKGTGEMTIEMKKECDDVLVECEDYCSKCDAIIDEREMPM